jgi:hypothetical protein
MTDEEVLVLAYHEAGHAIAAIHQKQPINEIVVHDDGGALHHVPEAERRSDEEVKIKYDRLRELGGVPPNMLRPLLVMYLAAAVAEGRHARNVRWITHDVAQCCALLDTTDLTEGARRQLAYEAWDEAERIIADYWLPVQILAERLAVLRKMDEVQIRAAIKSAGNFGAELLGLPVPPGHRGADVVTQSVPTPATEPHQEKLVARHGWGFNENGEIMPRDYPRRRLGRPRAWY